MDAQKPILVQMKLLDSRWRARERFQWSKFFWLRFDDVLGSDWHRPIIGAKQPVCRYLYRKAKIAISRLLKLALAGVAEVWNFVCKVFLPSNVDLCRDSSQRSKLAEYEGCRNGDFDQNQLSGQNRRFSEIANLEVLRASNRSERCQIRFFTPKNT